MKKILIAFIAIAGLFLNGCSGDNIFEEDAVTAKKVDNNGPPEFLNPFPPGGTGGGGGGSYHWTCPSSTCHFTNSFSNSTCVACGTPNPNPGNHQEPEGPSTGNRPPTNSTDPNQNYPTWYARPEAQKYFNEIASTTKYKEDSDYAAGVNKGWSMLVPRMKPYDTAEVTRNLCQMAINNSIPESDGSYKEGYIDGIIAALEAYNTNISKGATYGLNTQTWQIIWKITDPVIL